MCNDRRRLGDSLCRPTRGRPGVRFPEHFNQGNHAAHQETRMNAAIYARKSNDEGDKDIGAKSIEVQRDVTPPLAPSRGWTITKFYSDDAVTGAIYERPGLTQLLTDAAAGARDFDVLIVSAQDRIGRGDVTDTTAVIREIEKLGLQIWDGNGRQISVTGDPTAELMTLIESWTAKMERVKTVKRVKDAARRRFDSGLVVAGRVYGYKNDRLPGVKASAVLKPHPEQRAVVERI